MPVGAEHFALAMVLCDGICSIPAPGSEHTWLFNPAYAATLPVRINQLAVYCCVTECRDETPFTFKVIDVNDERDPVFETSGTLICDDPLGIIELDLVLGGIEFPQYGEYRFQLFSAGHPLMERKIMVIDPAATPSGDG